MVCHDPNLRPSATRLANHSTLLTPAELKAKLKPSASAATLAGCGSPVLKGGKGGNKRKKSISPPGCSGLPAEMPAASLGEESILDFQIRMTKKRLDLLVAQKAKLKEENPEAVAQAMAEFYTSTSEEDYMNDLVETEENDDGEAAAAAIGSEMPAASEIAPESH